MVHRWPIAQSGSRCNSRPLLAPAPPLAKAFLSSLSATPNTPRAKDPEPERVGLRPEVEQATLNAACLVHLEGLGDGGHVHLDGGQVLLVCVPLVYSWDFGVYVVDDLEFHAEQQLEAQRGEPHHVTTSAVSPCAKHIVTIEPKPLADLASSHRLSDDGVLRTYNRNPIIN